MSNIFKACRGCTERELGCHSWCERHAKELAKNEARKARQYLENEANGYVVLAKLENNDKAAKANRKNAGRTRPANYRKG